MCIRDRARPIKKGLDYFPVDTDIFENIQVRKLKNRYKSFGFLAYFTLLCAIYKKEGYFLQLSADYVYDLAARLGDTEEKIQEIIAYCLQLGLFNQQKYDCYHVLTSKSIQERYIVVVKMCIRDRVTRYGSPRYAKTSVTCLGVKIFCPL